jgi:hypothetical protein
MIIFLLNQFILRCQFLIKQPEIVRRLGTRWDAYQILVCQRQRVLTLCKFWQRFSHIMIFFLESLVPLFTSKAKKTDCLISLSIMEKFTMPYCCSPYLPSLVIPKVMIDFAADTTVVVQVWLDYAVTAILPAIRPTMLIMIGNTSYQNKSKV